MYSFDVERCRYLFLLNFFAHAATVKSLPGETALQGLLAMLSALLVSTSGMVRGLDAILRCAVTGASPLQKALEASALCEVVRAPDWEPQSGDFVRENDFDLPEYLQPAEMQKREERTRNGGERFKVAELWMAENHARIAKVGLWLGTKSSHVRLFFNHCSVAPRLSWLLITQRFPHFAPTVGDSFTSALRQIQTGVPSTELGQAHPSDSSFNGIELSGVDNCRSQGNSSTPVFNIAIISRDSSFKPSDKPMTLNGRKVHGTYCLPSGLELAIVHPKSIVKEL